MGIDTNHAAGDIDVAVAIQIVGRAFCLFVCAQLCSFLYLNSLILNWPIDSSAGMVDTRASSVDVGTTATEAAVLSPIMSALHTAAYLLLPLLLHFSIHPSFGIHSYVFFVFAEFGCFCSVQFHCVVPSTGLGDFESICEAVMVMCLPHLLLHWTMSGDGSYSRAMHAATGSFTHATTTTAFWWSSAATTTGVPSSFSFLFITSVPQWHSALHPILLALFSIHFSYRILLLSFSTWWSTFWPSSILWLFLSIMCFASLNVIDVLTTGRQRRDSCISSPVPLNIWLTVVVRCLRFCRHLLVATAAASRFAQAPTGSYVASC